MFALKPKIKQGPKPVPKISHDSSYDSIDASGPLRSCAWDTINQAQPDKIAFIKRRTCRSFVALSERQVDCNYRLQRGVPSPLRSSLGDDWSISFPQLLAAGCSYYHHCRLCRRQSNANFNETGSHWTPRVGLLLVRSEPFRENRKIAYY